MPKGGNRDKGGPGGGGGDGGDTGGNDVIFLPDLTAKKNFKLWFDQPETGELGVPWFNYTNTSTPLNVQGGVHRNDVEAELIYLSEADDIANMAGGDDYVVGNIGNDTLNGESGNDYIWGDTDGGFDLIDLSGADPKYGLDGNDVIDGGEGHDELFGDATTLGPGATGGNDIIFGGTGDDLISGDAEYLYGPSPYDPDVGGATGGNDTIDGGEGNDLLWGDGVLAEGAMGGADVFVFGDMSGHDVIFDYQYDLDKIDLTGRSGPGPRITDFAASGGDMVLTLSGGDTITFYDGVALGLELGDLSFV